MPALHVRVVVAVGAAAMRHTGLLEQFVGPVLGRGNEGRVISVRAAAVATQFIGAIWALLALLYANDSDSLTREFGIGIAVAATGLLVWGLVEWIER